MACNLTGKKILVTGAGRGFGQVIAIALFQSGCKVYALCRSGPRLESLVQECPDIVPITQDLRNWNETRATLEQMESLDGLVNNAAMVDDILPSLELTKDQRDYFMQYNMFSAMNCAQVVVKKMIASGKPGSIVNVSSIAAPLPSLPVQESGMANVGMDFATRQFALALGPHNIRVNSVNPSAEVTESSQSVREISERPVYNLHLDRTAAGRLSTVQDMVSSILYLLSDLSVMVTGTTHFVDTGAACN